MMSKLYLLMDSSKVEIEVGFFLSFFGFMIVRLHLLMNSSTVGIKALPSHRQWQSRSCPFAHMSQDE